VAFLKRFARVLLRILGFLLLAIFIWVAGPYFAFADFRPLESVTARLVLIGLVLAVWLLLMLVRRLKAYRASDMIAAAVMKPAANEAQTPADVAKLRERFEEAVATLKQQRRSGNNLYELPWYVIIGPPGSGKTTALVNSGLKFPLESRMGRGALKGVGGTRNCDWWFTDEAVFLDTAGRFTTQDSDAASDAAGWTEFLALLRKYRKRRPVNGVILTISASDLLTQTDAEREAHVDAVRRRLVEINRELKIQLPVYLMVTKTDLVAGFSEYFDDLTAEERAQVWGVTFPYEQSTSGEGPQVFPGEFDALIERLNERVFGRVDDDRDIRRRTRVFAFPQQMAALRDALTNYVSDVFASTRFDNPILLRGVYFTSGTQEGTPIDRLLGSMGRGFGVTPDLVAPTGRGKAYFVERLLREVMIGESGLAGLNTRLEWQKAALQLGAYAASLLLAAFAVIVLVVSYNRNSVYLEAVGADVDTLSKTPSVRDTAPPDRILSRLNAVRAVVTSADRHRADTPLGMRWGLYQGNAVGNAARDAYVRELDGLLIPLVANRFRERLVAYRGTPEKLAAYLKGYLMLGEPGRLDREYIARLVDVEFGRSPSGAATKEVTLATHFRSLLEFSDTLRPVPMDPDLIAQSRQVVGPATIPRLIYAQLQNKYAEDRARAVRLDLAAGGNAAQVLRRRSGTPLEEPLPAIYSKAVFNEVTGLDSLELVKQFADDAWVWGENVSASNTVRLTSQVFDLYERDFIAQWNNALSDLELTPFNSPAELVRALEILGGPASPIRGLVGIVVDNSLLYTDADRKQTEAIASAGKSITDRVGKLLAPVTEAVGMQVPTPGAIVTARFQPYRRLLEGEPGQTAVDRLLSAIAAVQFQLSGLAARAGATNSRDLLNSAELQGSMQQLRQQTDGLPPELRALLAPIDGKVVDTITDRVRAGVRGEFENVLSQCRQIISGRYPFRSDSPTEVQLADFGRLFGYGGIFDAFFQSRLADVVDTSVRPWRAQEGAGNVSPDMLRILEEAAQIRQVFFREGSQIPGFRFTGSIMGYDAGVSRFSLDIEGQALDSRNEQRPYGFVWPGPKASFVTLTMAQRFGDERNAEYRGPWAWFKFIDASAVEQVNAERNILTVKAGNFQGRIMIEAQTVLNPLASREWRQFTCGQ
jgi:type VI secretion system protein ImpL